MIKDRFNDNKDDSFYDGKYNLLVFPFQDDLHRDFELVQNMLEERQSEVERLQQELLLVSARLQVFLNLCDH